MLAVPHLRDTAQNQITVTVTVKIPAPAMSTAGGRQHRSGGVVVVACVVGRGGFPSASRILRREQTNMTTLPRAIRRAYEWRTSLVLPLERSIPQNLGEPRKTSSVG